MDEQVGPEGVAGGGPGGALRLAVVGDVHGNSAALRRVLDAVTARDDVQGLLVTGDLAMAAPSRRGGTAGAQEILALLRATGLPFVFVPGNHDTPVMDEPENVDGRIAALLGLRVLGIGGSPRAFGLPYEWADGSARIAQGACDLIVSHAPPALTRLGITSEGADAGSRQVREVLLQRRPLALVCGHIHEAVGTEEVDGVPCYNAGAIGGMFACLQYGALTLGGTAAFEHVAVAE